MKDILASGRSGFDEAATYRIEVAGRIPAKWRDRLEGMSVIECLSDSESLVTRLLGELADQAALAGVLNSLYELHLPVLAVERVS